MLTVEAAAIQKDGVIYSCCWDDRLKASEEEVTCQSFASCRSGSSNGR